MVIREVIATPVSVPATRTCTWSFGRAYGATRTIVQVFTAEGLVGLGETSGDKAAQIINERFAPKLEGVNPHEFETARWACLQRHKDVGYLADPASELAFSAVEMALWDIIGKRVGLPLFRLLGGPVRERAPFGAYAYTVALEEGFTESDVPKIMADIARKSIEDTNATLFEFKVGRHSVDCDIATVCAVREAVGPNIDLAVDANMGFSIDRARKFLAGVAGARLCNIEEPVPSLADCERLRLDFGVPVSTHCTDIEKLRNFPNIDSAVGDVNVDGGIFHTVRLAAVMQSHHKRYWLRSNSETGVSWAALCHLGMACLELDRPAQSLINWVEDDIVLGEPWFVRDGGVRPPEKAGLGIELDKDAFEHYSDRYRTQGALTRYHAK